MYEQLTERETEVLAELRSGRTNRQMAAQLHVSINTVKFHLKNIYTKLGVGSRRAAVRMQPGQPRSEVLVRDLAQASAAPAAF
jgi:DNA-binding CsgD family transcriptional regulator